MVVGREYELEAETESCIPPFYVWLRMRGELGTGVHGLVGEELLALSCPPSRRACSFRSMTSFGSHYRVDLEEAGERHVTFDSGVAELDICGVRGEAANNGTMVELVRVGILKDILVLRYGSLDMVLMVVSWVAKDTEHRPRLRRDAHGFWLANMAAQPRDTHNPYILPALASQVCTRYIHSNMWFDWRGKCTLMKTINFLVAGVFC